MNVRFGPKNKIYADRIYLRMGQNALGNENTLIAGSPGSGKSYFVLGPNLMQLNDNYIVNDPSQDLSLRYGEFMRQQGYDVKIFNLMDSLHSNHYNPFHYIRDEQDVFEFVDILMRNTMDENQKGGDPFWTDAVKLLMNAIILYIWKYLPKQVQTLSAILKIMRSANIDESVENVQSSFDLLFKEIEDKFGSEELAVTQYKGFKMGAGKTLKSILISGLTKFQIFDLESVKRLTCTDDMDFEHFADRRSILFLVLPTVKESMKCISALLMTQMFNSLFDYCEKRTTYSYRLKDSNNETFFVKQGRNVEERELAKTVCEAKLQAVIDGSVKYNEKSKLYEILDSNGVVISWRGKEKDALATWEKMKNGRVEKCDWCLPRDCAFWADEFKSCGAIPSFSNILSNVRKYHISITIIVQSLSQLEHMYREEYETIIGDCEVFVFLGCRDMKTCEYVSKLMGKRTNVLANTTWQSGNNNGSESFNISSVDLMSPDRLSRLPRRKCVVLMGQYYPYLGNKYNPKKHPNYRAVEETKGLFQYPDGNEGFINKILEEEDKLDVRKVSEKKEAVTETHDTKETTDTKATTEPTETQAVEEVKTEEAVEEKKVTAYEDVLFKKPEKAVSTMTDQEYMAKVIQEEENEEDLMKDIDFHMENYGTPATPIKTREIQNEKRAQIANQGNENKDAVTGKPLVSAPKELDKDTFEEFIDDFNSETLEEVKQKCEKKVEFVYFNRENEKKVYLNSEI